MKNLLAVPLIAGTLLGAFSAANAADGCGPGGYRGPHGRCRGGQVVAPGVAVGVAPGVAVGVGVPGLVIGNYYRGRGYWDGHRYYQHRERWHGGWRYR